MRKITSKYKHAKNMRRNQIVVGVLLISIMVLGTFGYSFQGGDDSTEAQKFEYNNFNFVKENNLWNLKLGNTAFYFQHTPKETEDLGLTASLKSINNYYNKPLYIYSEPRGIETTLYKGFYPLVQRIQFACPELSSDADFNCSPELPIKNCSNNVFILVESDTVQLAQEENCVVVKGPLADFNKISEEVLFKILGVKL